MGIIINIDEALKQRSRYNVLREPLNDLLKDRQEEWEKKNPIDLLFQRGTIDTFQETYTSNIGFDHAFAETGDYAVSPIFNTAEGFSATYRTRTFQGSFIITQQVLEDGKLGQVRDDAKAFMKRWHGDLVEYAMKALEGAFGADATFTGGDGTKSKIKLTSADTVDGSLDGTKNPLFTNAHTVVKRDGMSDAEFNAAKQSNMFKASIDSTKKADQAILFGGDDPGQIMKLADFLYQVISAMENYKDDNNKIAGVSGAKSIVIPNDPRLKAAMNAALSMTTFDGVPNTAYQIASVESTPYLNAIAPCQNGVGFFVIDHSYNTENHGLEFTERIPLTMDVIEQKRPRGIVYDARQRFDVNVASWRGIAYCYIGASVATGGAWNNTDKFTHLYVSKTLVNPTREVAG